MAATKRRRDKAETPTVGKEYSWRDGSRYGVRPEVFAEVVERIEARNGRATAEAVVAAAEPESSPIHAMFCWDDTVAARRYREEQARGAIRSLRVVVTLRGPETQTTGPCIAYVSVTTPDGRGYVNTPTAMANVTMRDQAVEEARRAFESLRERYRHLGRTDDEMRRIFAMIDGWK